jgi:hypothetical protein
MDTLNVQAYAQGQYPEEDPCWDPSDDRDYQRLEQDQEALLRGMEEGGKKVMNMSKTQKSSKGQLRAPASFMCGYVRPSACTSFSTQRQLKTRG